MASYHSPKLEGGPRPDKGGYGVFAKAPIKEGELLVAWGGAIYTAREFAGLPSLTQRHSLQVEEDLYQVPIRPADPADFINHCCDPNAGLSGQIALVALRDIAPGEEICYDYAMSDGTPYDEFDCLCGAPNCRGRVTGDDWAIPELQARYQGYFSPYLQRRIDRLQKQAARGEGSPTEQEQPMYFFDPEQRPTKELAPGVRARTFWGERLLLSLVDFEPNAEVPRHSHPHEQGGIVIAGELEFTIGDETRMVRPGDTYVIPGGVEHSARATAGAVQVLDVFSPVREEYKY